MQVQKAMSRSPKKIAVIGCGIIGITSALTAQRAGAQVTIYTKDVFHRTRSVRANGSWTPASHMALASDAPSNLGDVWEKMTRISWKNLRQYIGLAGNPLAFADHYYLSDTPFDEPLPPAPPSPMPVPEYYELGNRIGDITPNLQTLSPDAVYGISFKVPRTARLGRWRFCVEARDAEGLRDRECRSFRVRR